MKRAPGALALALVLLPACGGGMPLLHPAATLPKGEVRAEAGFSANVPLGDFSGALLAAQNDAAASGGNAPLPGTDPTFAKGALVEASVAPGLAPIGGARVGIGWHSEGGIAYTGRAMRIDLRRSFDLGSHWALSIGAGVSAVLYEHEDGGALPYLALAQTHGWGGDVPLLVGYESDDGLYMLWVGARGGGEHVDIGNVTSEPGAGEVGGQPIGLSATRYWGGGLAGAAVGFRHLHVALEADAAYATISGSYNRTQVQVGGLTLAPAAALWWRF